MQRFERPYVHIYYDEVYRCVSVMWKGYTTSPQFREGLTTGVEFVRHHKSTRWLTDARSLMVISVEDEKWVIEVILPALKRAGRKYSAIVANNSAVLNMAMAPMKDQMITMGVLTRQFRDLTTARNWLSSLPD